MCIYMYIYIYMYILNAASNACKRKRCKHSKLRDSSAKFE